MGNVRMTNRSKYRAKRTVVDGINFDSKKEAKRYMDLKSLRESGEVAWFLMQVPFRLPGNTTYRADFLVFWKDGRVTVEDVKGFRTEVYKLKKRQVEDLYPITITEV
jgi:hypothetical protein